MKLLRSQSLLRPRRNCEQWSYQNAGNDTESTSEPQRRCQRCAEGRPPDSRVVSVRVVVPSASGASVPLDFQARRQRFVARSLLRNGHDPGRSQEAPNSLCRLRRASFRSPGFACESELDYRCPDPAEYAQANSATGRIGIYGAWAALAVL